MRIDRLLELPHYPKGGAYGGGPGHAKRACFHARSSVAGAESDGPFCGDSISFAHDDDARRQPFVAGLEGFLPPHDVDRAGGHAVVVGDGREAR